MPTEIRRKDVKTLIQQGRAQLVEVLPASAYRKEHLPKALNIPLSQLNAESTSALKKDVAVIVYCSDYLCDMSARAAWRLETLGFQEVYRYTAGKADWLAAGYETEGMQARKSTLKKVLKKAVLTCSPKERLGPVKNRRPLPSDICVVVNDRGIVMGLIHGDAWEQDPLKQVMEVMDLAPRTFRPDQDPENAMKEMKKEDLEHALVTTSDGELLGFIQRTQKKTQKSRKAA
jgi:rhodanese-related sulfurtransferase